MSTSATTGDGGATAPETATLAPPPTFPEEKATGRLVAFRDDEEVAAFAARWKANEEEKAAARLRPPPKAYPMGGPHGLDGGPPPIANVAPPAAAPAPSAAVRSAAPREAASKSASKSESITNNQHADVDEGDIVKLHGNHLVVLRRGRIFTLSLAGDRAQTSRVLDAFGPDIDPRGTWYDEMVVEGDDVVVVGFSYQRGGTEIGLFRIDDKGGLTYRGTWHLRSNDYYSARNYASRIVDGRLVFYAPLYLSASERDLPSRFPAVRRWKKDAKPTDFVRTLSATKLYRLEDELPVSGSAALHTVTSCDLRTPDLTCESIGILGPAGRVFYVSPSNVYVWMQDWARHTVGHRPLGLLAKLPITRTRGPVTAVRVAGMPTDQFSFDEEEDGHLDVLVRSESNGDAMFASEATAGAAALLRLPKNLFSEGVPAASKARYRTMPRPDGYSVQNRFVGPWLLYGAGTGYVTDHRGQGQLYAVKVASEEEPKVLVLDQGVDRIEPMGGDAVVVGSRDKDLVFTPIELGKEARARRDFVRHDAAQGELRSHGFFYKPAPGKPREGVVGLPIRSAGARGGRYLVEGSASVLFLSHKDLGFAELGALEAAPLATNHDGCRASCVDWYGNARPIFAKGRIFALMGYELVEGRVDGGRLGERSRLSFAPRGGPPADEWY